MSSAPPVTLSSLWYNKKTRSVIFQTLALVGVFLAIGFGINNVILKFQELDKSFGFDFLWWPAGYDLPDNQLLIEQNSRLPHYNAAIAGILNTLYIAFWGCVAATFLGFTMGVLRMSNNWLVSRVVYCWVEIIRNIPLLLQILLWYGIMLVVLPAPKQALSLGDSVFLSKRGLVLPQPIAEPLLFLTLLVFVAGVVFTVLYRRRAKKIQDETGETRPVLKVGLLAMIALPLLVFFVTGMPVSWELAAFKGFNFKGGMQFSPQFVALWFALSVYTAAFIAEVVRAGIQAVSHGQTEAAYALGIKPSRTMNLVVLPQALRVIIPPLASQYLNLTKNSSLAIAIGFHDTVATLGGTTLNQTGKEMECMMMVLAFYLVVSISISIVMNWYNRAVALVER